MPATNGACDTRKGPYTVAAGAGVRAIDATADRRRTLERHRAEPVQRHDAGRPADTGTSPSASATPRPAASPPATTSSRSATSRRRRRGPTPRTYTGTLLIDDSPPPTPYPARWTCSRRTAAERARRRTRGTPRAPTRARSGAGRRARTAADSQLDVIGNLASRTPWDVRRRRPTRRRSRRAATTRARPRRGAIRGSPGPIQFQPIEAERNYSFPLTNDWFDVELQPRRCGRARRAADISAAVDEPVRDAQPDARLVVPASASPRRTGTRSRATSASTPACDAPGGENDPGPRPVRRRARSPAPPTSRPRQREHDDRCRTAARRSRTCTSWQPIASAFYSPCVDGDYDSRHRPRVRAT